MAALEAIRQAHPGPPMVARALYLLHAAMFDAWAAYDRKAVGVHWAALGRRPADERSEQNQRTAMHYAAYRVLCDLFPGQKGIFGTALQAQGWSAQVGDTNPATPAGVGNLAAQELLAVRRGDESNQGNEYKDTSNYTPLNTPDSLPEPGHWQPLRVPDGRGGFTVETYIAPHWGKVTPFALKKPEQFRPAAPADWGTPEFGEQVREVLAYSAGLTPLQKAVAEYWADGPNSELPPGHWTMFAQFVSERDKHSVADDAKMFLAMTGAVMDASVSCWEAKRAYDYVRPISAIHHLLKGKTVRGWGGPGKDNTEFLAEAWLPYQAATVVTPPFPEYTSGHSTFSAAAATALRLFTHRDVFGHGTVIEVNSSKVEPHLPTTRLEWKWATLSDAADEAGLSRRYGGIHFKDGDLAGREAGRKIGRQAYLKALHHFNPQLHPTY